MDNCDTLWAARILKFNTSMMPPHIFNDLMEYFLCLRHLHTLVYSNEQSGIRYEFMSVVEQINNRILIRFQEDFCQKKQTKDIYRWIFTCRRVLDLPQTITTY